MQRLNVTFAVLGALAAVLFGISVWQDSAREWKDYQKTFLRMERDVAQSGPGDSGWRARTTRINQILVGDQERVDRCTTCHLGVEDPRFADAAQPYRTHPSIPEHPFEDFGCTLCHSGQGLATTTEAAHGHVAFWEEPMLAGPYLESSCGACHQAGVDGAPWLARGRDLYTQSGCIACHKIRGMGGTVGPELTSAGDSRREPEWHLEHFRDPQGVSPGSTMPPYAHLSEEDLVSLTVYMLSLKDVPSRLLYGPS